MDIVACTDKKNVMPTGVMMHSVCVNNMDTDIVFHVVVDEDVSSVDCEDLMDVVAQFAGKTISVYPVTREILNNTFPGVSGTIPRASYFRLFLSELLPESIDKVLYLDGDIIVRGSLACLWDIDLSSYALAAVPDMRTGTIDRYNRLRYSPNKGYFNAGVLLINLKYWREHQVLNSFLDFITNNPSSIVAHDQDVLNYMFQDLKLTLPIKYNLQHGFLWKSPLCYYWDYEDEILEARKDPVILHFTSANKPYAKYQRPRHPFSSSFVKYQNMTKWKGVRIDNRTVKLKIKCFCIVILEWLKIRPSSQIEYIKIAPID